MKTKVNMANALQISEKLKLIIVNEPEMDVRVAVERLKELVRKPEFWASDWSDK